MATRGRALVIIKCLFIADHEPGWSQRFRLMLGQQILLNEIELEILQQIVTIHQQQGRAGTPCGYQTYWYDIFLPIQLLALTTLFNPFSGTYNMGESIRLYNFVSLIQEP